MSFQNRYLPVDLQGDSGLATVSGKPILIAHLESVEVLGTINEADFTPPPDAFVAPLQVTLSAAATQDLHLEQVEPQYPPIARAARVDGIVILRAIIGTDGKVLDIGVVSGHAMLLPASIDAVRQWVYKPYLINNEPVEINTTIKVIFPSAGAVFTKDIPPGGHPHAIP
jgi:TonB family protein